MKVVIIGQNEAPHIFPMLESLKGVSAERIWVCDRCSDGSEDILRGLGENTLTTPPELEGRQTSYSRNLGLGKAGMEEGVLFLDGDRYPVQGDISILQDSPTDVTLLALEDDFRITERGADKEYEKYYGKVTNFFYSPGIYFKPETLKKITEFQRGELFSIEAQKEWGIEDTYLGDVCYSLGLSCSFRSDIRLHGTFEKRELDNIGIFRKRLEMRDKLDGVIW